MLLLLVARHWSTRLFPKGREPVDLLQRASRYADVATYFMNGHHVHFCVKGPPSTPLFPPNHPPSPLLTSSTLFSIFSRK